MHIPIQEHFQQVKQAARKAVRLEAPQINQVLLALADATLQRSRLILEANRRDLKRMDQHDPKYDRLQLTEERLHDIASDIRKIVALPSPLGTLLESRELSQGLHLKKISVPLGVVGIIYEARPNVTFDVFSLCLKAGNICILKGGSDAEFSNKAIVSVIQEVLKAHDLDEHILYLMPSDREATRQMLKAVEVIDVIIPRGSRGLIDFVRENSRVPVIETGAGIVHTYFDVSGDLQKGRNIIFNAKTRRVSVCNALDCLIIHQARLQELPQLAEQLAGAHVIIYADTQSYRALQSHYPAQLLQPAQPAHFGTEFLDYKMAIKTVRTLEEALDHIALYSSKHSEAIVAEDSQTVALFMQLVDAAAVYANTSTAFTDGGQFGMGAEIGISTQKLHARGPMALPELTSYKWLISSDGAVR